MNMFDKVFANMKNKIGNDQHNSATQEEHAGHSKRKYTRRICDTCASTVNGQDFPVVDWSLGGMQVSGDVRTFSLDDNVDIMLKFKLSDTVVNIPHKARIVRKSHEKLGLQFTPLTKAVRDDLQNVVDDYVKSRVG